VSREAWSAMFVTFGLANWEPPVTIDNAPPASSASVAEPTIRLPAPSSWPCWHAALYLLREP
jgi:hypothetical protein